MHAETLQRLFPAAKLNEPLKRYTAWKIGGPADALLEPSSIEELIEAVEVARKHEISVTILGGGTNVLILDGGIRGLTIRLARALRFEHNRHERARRCRRSLPCFGQHDRCAWPRGLRVRDGYPGDGRRRGVHERRGLRYRDPRDLEMG